ncbi:hypothetical protein ACOTHJ_12830 [Achromobacter xylosoxidans]|uniref:hypothetical protein n=1 Tax=Achromobacter anxifer TaxID=1287737 RepID=UPI00155BE579|nr:hypothetical protein [Achromobacter anxifer]CAB5514580.1 hypothetical protein LMG26857_03639 [Achromobacter anxifer]
MIVATLKTAAKAYSAASGAVHVVRHPVQATQDAIRKVLVSAVIKVILPLAGAQLVDELSKRISMEKSFQVQFDVPDRVRTMAFDDDALRFLNNLVNDALAAPLGALGLSLGEMVVRQAPDTDKLEIQGIFRLLATSETGQLGQQLMLQNSADSPSPGALPMA